MLEAMDAVLLDSIAKLIEIDTSEIFFGHPRKFHSVFDDVQRILRNVLKTKTNFNNHSTKLLHV